MEKTSDSLKNYHATPLLIVQISEHIYKNPHLPSESYREDKAQILARAAGIQDSSRKGRVPFLGCCRACPANGLTGSDAGTGLQRRVRPSHCGWEGKWLGATLGSPDFGREICKIPSRWEITEQACAGEEWKC